MDDKQSKFEATKEVVDDTTLREYLIQDLAATKIQLNESRRLNGRLWITVIVVLVLIIAAIAGFTTTIYFVVREQSEQIHAIFSSNWASSEKETAVMQDNLMDMEGSVINFHSSNIENTVTIRK